MSDSLIDSGDPPPMSSSMDEFDPFTASTNKANGTSTDKSPTTGNPLYDLLHGEGESNGDDIVDLTSPTIDSLKQSSTSTNSDLLAEINSELQFDQSECLEQNGSVAMTTSYLSENGEEETMTTTTTTETRMTESYEEEDGMVVTKTETISESHEVPVKKSQEVEVLQEEDEEEEEEEKAYMERVETKEAEKKEEEEEEFVKYEEEVVKYEEDIEAEAYLEEEEEEEKKEEEKEEIQVQGTAEIETNDKQKEESEEEEDEDDGTANESENITSPPAQTKKSMVTEYYQPANSGKVDKPAQRFEDTISDYQPPKRYTKPEEKEPKAASTVFNAGGNDNRCKVCEKRVYQMEQIIVEKNMYHKSCFKCEKCKRVLSLGSYSGIEGRVFCKPHFIEMFKQKGNYEEGFGMERHKNKWVKKEDMPVVKSPEIERMEANLEDGNAPEITRAEDVVDDGIGEIKSLRNARSLFEAKNEEPTTPQKLERRPGTKLVKTSAQSNGHDEDEDIEKDPNIAREERKRDEFQFSSLSSTREALEQKARDEAEPRVRSPGEGQGQDLPGVNTKQILSRFTSQQEEDSERKPVRKITPPHGEPLIVTNIPDDVEIERDPNIVRSDEAVQREEEIPKAEKTRGLLAKFKALEKADAEPPSPSRAPPSKIKIDRRGIDESSEVKVNGESGVFENQPEQFQQYQPSAESGVYENVPEQNEDVVREQEERDREEEKPKAGVTRSLLSRWKTMESEVESAPPPMPGRGRQFTPPRDDSRRVRTPSPVPSGFAVKNEYVDPKDEIAKSKGSVSENVPAAKPDVVRETDINQDEKAVPEKQFTKSALGKFQKIQEDAGKEKFTSQRKGLRKVSPQKKQPVASQQIDGDENGDDMLDDVYEANADIVRSDDPAPDELPPPSFAKNLLAKFRSMEDRNRPPPSPARSASMRNLTRPKKFTVRHRSNSEENIEIPREERPKPEGGEIEAVNGDRYNYENSPGSGVSENTPDVKPDLVRESDTHTEEELPERGTAKNLLAKFQAMGQAQ